MSSALLEGLKRAAKSDAAARTPKNSAAKNGKAQVSRVGTVMIGGHFDPAVKSSLKLIQAKHPQLTTQQLLEEALDLLFERHKVPQAARVR